MSHIQFQNTMQCICIHKTENLFKMKGKERRWPQLKFDRHSFNAYGSLFIWTHGLVIYLKCLEIKIYINDDSFTKEKIAHTLIRGAMVVSKLSQ